MWPNWILEKFLKPQLCFDREKHVDFLCFNLGYFLRGLQNKLKNFIMYLVIFYFTHFGYSENKINIWRKLCLFCILVYRIRDGNERRCSDVDCACIASTQLEKLSTLNFFFKCIDKKKCCCTFKTHFERKNQSALTLSHN